jgi:hypothetical protein
MTNSRRLMIFPCETGKQDGYSIAVTADVARLAPGPEDLQIYRTFEPAPPQGNVRTIGTASATDKVRNILSGRPPYELSEHQLRDCLEKEDSAFEEIFSGEIFFYRALRRVFPSAHIYARSHNLYSLARCRQMLGRHPNNFRHALNLYLYSKLEMEILHDKKATMIFITEEELAFARLQLPLLQGEFWPVIDPHVTVGKSIHPPTALRLAFLGSAAASHTVIGLEVICRMVMPSLRARIPHLEFHLYGHGTERFQDAALGIMGHGRYPGTGLPFEGNALFCVPDIHGMGIKMKIADLLKAGAPFISTPLGLSGYHLPPHPHILVQEMDDWADCIHAYFRSAGLSGVGGAGA